jgi:ABC-type anion transport system duplicated permease subunit
MKTKIEKYDLYWPGQQIQRALKRASEQNVSVLIVILSAPCIAVFANHLGCLVCLVCSAIGAEKGERIYALFTSLGANVAASATHIAQIRPSHGGAWIYPSKEY